MEMAVSRIAAQEPQWWRVKSGHEPRVRSDLSVSPLVMDAIVGSNDGAPRRAFVS
jgi:hypothetical protein